MTTSNYTTLLGLALPTTGDLSGQWGNEVNDYISKYVDSSVAGTQTISGSQTAVTLSRANGVPLSQAGSSSTGSSQYQVINCTGNPAGTLTVTIDVTTGTPTLSNSTYSQTFAVINGTSTSQSVVVRATTTSGTSTGVTLVSGEKALIAWNGSDFIKVATSTVDGVSTIAFGTTGLTPSSATSGAVTVAGTLVAANGGTGQSSYTTGDLLYATGSTALSKLGIGTNGQILTSTGTAPQWSTLSGVAVTTFSAGTTGFTPSSATSGAVTLAGTLATTNGGTGLTSFTANGVVYASSSSALTTGSALTFTGTNLATTASNLDLNPAATAPNISFREANTYRAYLEGNSSGLIFGIGSAATEQMRLTSTGLGIGTSSPAYKLDVVGTIQSRGTHGAGSFNAFIIKNTASSQGSGKISWRGSTDNETWAIAQDQTVGAGNLEFNYLGSNKAVFDSSGNLGLGVTPSAWQSGLRALQIGATGSIYNNGLNTAFFGLNYYTDSGGTNRYLASTSASAYGQVSGAHQWYTAGSGTAGNIVTFTQAMTLDSSGNLGIGTSSPTGRLHISTASGNTDFVHNVTGAGTAARTTYQRSGSVVFYAGLGAWSGTDTYQIATTSGPLTTIDTSGNLGIGTTSPLSSLDVVSTSSGVSQRIRSTFSGGTNVALRIQDNTTGTSDSDGIYLGRANSINYLWTYENEPWVFATNNTERARITSGGDVGIGTSSPAAKLHVNGPVIIANAGPTNELTFTGTDYTNIYSETTGGMQIGINSTGNSASVEFLTNNAERFRIGPAGQIGLSGANYGTSGQVLTSNGSGSAPTWQTASGGTPGGSSGQVQFNNSGAFGGSANLFWDNTNARLGIRTSSPTCALEVDAPAAATGTVLAITNSAQWGWDTYLDFRKPLTNGGAVGLAGRIVSLYESSNNYGFTFNTTSGGTNTERMRLTSGGVVGIGTSSPASNATRFSLVQPSTPSGTLPTVYYSLGWDNQGSQDNAGIFLQHAGGGVPNGSLLTARIGSNTSFTLNNCGADNNVNAAGGRPPVYLYAGPSGNYSSYGQPPASNFSAAGAVPRMAIYSEMTGMYDGFQLTGLSIKLAGSYGGGSTRDVYCSAVQATTAFGSDRGYGTSYGYYANVSSNITANYAFYAAAGDAAKPGGGSWASTSDARVKNVIGQYARGLQDVLKINVVDFTYNGKGGHPASDRVYTGVIAQEMQTIFPEMVKVHRAKLEETDEQDTDILMVDNSALVYALVNSIKELKTELDTVKAELATLKGN